MQPMAALEMDTGGALRTYSGMPTHGPSMVKRRLELDVES